MRKKRLSITVLAAVLMFSVYASGCGEGNEQKQESSESVRTSSVESSAASDTSEDNSPGDNSSGSVQESSIDEKQLKTEQAKKDIAVLLEYKKNIPPVSEQSVTYTGPTKEVSNETNGKVYYVNSVIRDINNDGKLEMLVKYDCVANHNGIHNCYLYDIVSVVDGKAVSAGLYKNEGWNYSYGK